MPVDGAGVENLQHYDTIVLGAGIAGLAFASRILQANATGASNLQLRILEARDRIGGRIAAVHVNGCRLDTGANWIHGTGTTTRPNPLVEILPYKRYRSMKGSVLFGALSVNGEKNVVAGTNSHSSLVVPAAVATLIVSSAQKAIDEVQALSATIPVEAAKQTSVLRALVNSKAFQDAFDRVPKEHHGTLGALFQGVECMEAAPLLAQTAEPSRTESDPGVGLLEYAVDDFDGEQAFLQDGFVAVINEIAKPLVEANAIALDTVVTRVNWAENPIIIETSRGRFTAKEVVCTIPLGVLKDSSRDTLFAPNLPVDKQEAIENLGFGTLDKIYAIYSTPWWNNEPYRSAIKKGLIQSESQDTDDLPDSFLGFTSELDGISIGHDGSVSPSMYRLPVMKLDTLTDQPVLCAFVSCKTATTVEGMRDEDVGGLFHRSLTQWFGIEPPAPEAIHVTRWAQDPYSRGSYSHFIAGISDFSHRGSLQEPMVNEAGAILRFAGEHCSRDHFAMVHGALLDGWRAASASLQHSQGH